MAGVWFRAKLLFVLLRVEGVWICCFCICWGVVRSWLLLALFEANGGLFDWFIWSNFVDPLEAETDVDADEPKSNPPTTTTFPLLCDWADVTIWDCTGLLLDVVDAVSVKRISGENIFSNLNGFSV